MSSSTATTKISGQCKKMPATLGIDDRVNYRLSLGSDEVVLSESLGSKISIQSNGVITCIHCGKSTKKSYSQGYCFPCMKKLAQCDLCIMSPERCHYAAGTCREPVWADEFCMTDHIVYLANTTAAKVGLTRNNQIPTRWIDQGAEQALPVMRVATRQQAGFVEDALRQHIADKTNWRNMLKSSAEPIDLISLRDDLIDRTAKSLESVFERFGQANFNLLSGEQPIDLVYEVLEYPTKITSLNLDKNPLVEGQLLGIKGQYLILDTGVINLRKYTGYMLEVTLN